ncbi:MAG: hypothetical protein U0905_18300 [Pirellulales bacterium]
MKSSKIFEHLISLKKNPKLLIPGISDFFSGWLMTRDWLSIGLTFPLIIVLNGALFFSIYVRSQHREILAGPFIRKMERQYSTSKLVRQLIAKRLAERVEGVGNDEADTQDLNLDEMALCVRHAMGLDPTNQSLDFRYAIVLDMLGETERSQKLLDKLAPEGMVRFVPAHAWKAVTLLSEKDTSRIDLTILEHHLKAAATWTDNDYRVYQLASKICENERQMGMAIQYAKISAERQPDTILRWAELADRMGRKNERKDSLDRGIRHFTARMTTDSDQTEARLGLAACQKLLDRTNDALTTLRAGMRLTNCNHDRIRPALVEMLLSKHQKDVAEEKSLMTFQPTLLNEAADLEPLNASVGEATAWLVWKKGKMDDSEACVAGLKRLMVEGNPTANTHLYLGQVYYSRGQYSNAIQQGQLALSKNATLQAALIMVAQAAMKTAPPNPTLANEMVERAMAKETKNAVILELQGDVSHANGDLQKAAQAWEAALKMDASNNGLHRKLYDSYRKLGLVDEAEQHKPFLKEAAEESAPGLTSRK